MDTESGVEQKSPDERRAAFELVSSVLHLQDSGDASLFNLDDGFWARRRAGFTDGLVFSASEFTSTWDRWERHLSGDELVAVMAGSIDLELDDGSQRWSIPMASGSGYVVPRGAWHRAVVPAPSRMLFVTPSPARTEERSA